MANLNFMKTRRVKPYIELAPDQPLTTEGKPRARVYVACLQCRTRKIRCDGAKPTCHNCAHRTDDCTYDPEPKRRGPDKTPGARQRLAPGDNQEGSVDPAASPRRRRRRRRQRSDLASPTLVVDSQLAPSHFATGPLVPDPTQPLNLVSTTTQVYQDDYGPSWDSPGITPEPSLDFVRQTWWDSLVDMYSLSLLSPSHRQQATKQISSDIRFFFRASNYWFSFINVPRFLSIYLDPVRRARMQPSFLPAALAIAVIFQSSEAGFGQQGRQQASRLRDIAQSALEASLNACWIDEELAQAAWLLALFEICTHPEYTGDRSSSSLAMLDTIIRSLSLTLVDVDDPTSSQFSPLSVPSISPSRLNTSSNARVGTTHTPHSSQTCSCASRSLGKHWGAARKYTPLWLASPAWDSSWTEAEIRKEACRRLCWSTLVLTAGHTAYITSENRTPPELFILEPANFALLFPAEALDSSGGHSGKDTVWSLNYRTMLLWHGCLKMRYNPSASVAEMTRFGLDAWREADALEAALNAHECDFERSFLFQGREYLFNVRMLLMLDFQVNVPMVISDTTDLFCQKATEWLTHQGVVAERVVQSLGSVTGSTSQMLLHRPYFVLWFVGQINRALSLWERDHSLTLALDVSIAFLKPIDYLNALWPCREQRRRTRVVRERLAAACIQASRPSPPELNEL